MWVQSLGQEDPLEEGMATHTAVFLPGESHGQRSLASSVHGQAIVHGVEKSWTRLKQLSMHASDDHFFVVFLLPK